MDQNKFTIKAQEVIQGAQSIAQESQNQAVDCGHLLKSILTNDKEVTPFLLNELNVDAKILELALDKITEGYPKVSGGQIYMSNELNQVLTEAFKGMKEFGDEYVSVEVLLHSLLSAKGAVGSLLKDNGITKKNLKESIMNLRGGEPVTSASQEGTYQSLEKFAKNLNALAKSGKLDPVIGRDDEIRRVLQILTRRTKNNPILIGEPGVGKTAIAEGIAV